MQEKHDTARKEIKLFPGKHIISSEGSYWNNKLEGSPVVAIQIDLPEDILGHSDHTGIVIASGILYPRTNSFVQRLREMFVRKEHVVTTFDYSGLAVHGGESTGPLEAHSLGQMALDLETAVNTLNEQLEDRVKNVVLVGPSAGGNAVATYLNNNKSSLGQDKVKSSILIGTPNNFLHFRKIYDPKTQWNENGEGLYRSSSGSQKKLSINLWEDSQDNGINFTNTDSLEIPTLIIGGGSDSFCTESDLTQMNNNRLSRKVIIKGADHNFTEKDKELANTMEEFLSKI